MGKFTVIPQSTFEEMQMDAGVLLYNFDPSNPQAPDDEDIICATTGGITASCTAEYSDLGEDVDNCPVNMKELKHLDSWTCSLEFTSLGTSPASIKLALGAADIDSTDATKIVPRSDLSQDDFTDIWWVGDRADGGMVAVQLLNALSTEGFSIETSKAGKGQVGVTLTGHVSIDAQDIVPMVFYSSSAGSPVTYTYTEVTPVGTENPAEEEWYILSGDRYFPTHDTAVDSNKTYYERTTA